MKQVPDRKKLRREYLKKKRNAAFALSALNILAVLSGMGAILCWAMVIWFYWSGGRALAVALGVIMFSFMFMLAIVRGLRKGVRRISSNIPYVPPFTPDTLPADEILVRGSEEPPTAQREVLLRAAKAVETSEDELLRVTNDRSI